MQYSVWLPVANMVQYFPSLAGSFLFLLSRFASRLLIVSCSSCYHWPTCDRPNRKSPSPKPWNSFLMKFSASWQPRRGFYSREREGERAGIGGDSAGGEPRQLGKALRSRRSFPEQFSSRDRIRPGLAWTSAESIWLDKCAAWAWLVECVCTGQTYWEDGSWTRRPCVLL